MKGGSASDGSRGSKFSLSNSCFLFKNIFFVLESYKVPMIIGISIGGILLLLLVAIIIAAVTFLKRRKTDGTEKRTTSSMYSIFSYLINS